jgi:hypothetical protein
LLLLARAAAAEVVVARPFGAEQLLLERDAGGRGALALRDRGGVERALPCDPLDGAWGLWVADVDGDGRPEVLVALRRPALHDPVPENRLHVYAVVDGQCVPLWRGTRLAGRFDELRVRDDRLLALERTGGGRRRVAEYRWTGFGYAVDHIAWAGRGRPPARAWIWKGD